MTNKLQQSGNDQRQSSSAMAEGEALNLTPEETRIAGESLAAAARAHLRLDVRVMERPKQHDPRQQWVIECPV